MAVQIKNDNVLIGHINDLQSSINNLDNRVTITENKFAQYLPLTGGGLTGDLSVGGIITGKLNGAARYLTSPDTRSTVINPSDITASENGVRFDFKASSTIGLSSTPAYSGVMTYRPYSSAGDWTGGPAHQIAFNANGLHWRKSSGDTTWADWYTVLDTGNYSSKVPRSYGFVKFATSGAVSVASSGTTISKTISLTTHGRPVFLAVSGDNNPTDSTSWFNIYFYRSGTQLSHQIDESHGSSWNIPFCMVYLDIVAAGTYTYECRITSGSGATNLNEDSARQSPNFVAFEI